MNGNSAYAIKPLSDDSNNYSCCDGRLTLTPSRGCDPCLET